MRFCKAGRLEAFSSPLALERCRRPFSVMTALTGAIDGVIAVRRDCVLGVRRKHSRTPK